MFEIGQKVQCVDDGLIEPGLALNPGGLKKGRVYHIKNCFECPRSREEVVYLEEIRRPVLKGDIFGEQGFSVSRFRPLQSRPTDISIFEALLKTADGKVSA